jgi:hypothetical protein
MMPACRNTPMSLATYAADKPSAAAISGKVAVCSGARAKRIKQRKPYSSWAVIFMVFLRLPNFILGMLTFWSRLLADDKLKP